VGGGHNLAWRWVRQEKKPLKGEEGGILKRKLVVRGYDDYPSKSRGFQNRSGEPQKEAGEVSGGRQNT